MAAPSRFRGPIGWLRDRPIWTKLGLIMIVPIIATIVVGVQGLLDHVANANAADQARSLAVLSGDAGRLVDELQDERAAAIILITAPDSQVNALKNAYTEIQGKTDAVKEEYRYQRSTLADTPNNVDVLLADIEAKLADLATTRQDVLERSGARADSVGSDYDGLIANLLRVRNVSAQLSGTPALTDRMRAASAVAAAKEYLSQERVLILEAVQSGEFTEQMKKEYIVLRDAFARAMEDFRFSSNSAQQQLYNVTVAGPQLREGRRYEEIIDKITGNTIPMTAVPAAKWDEAMVARSALMNDVEVELNEQATTYATDLGDAAQRAVLIETGVLLATLLLGVLFAWLVARSMARSLRDLRQGALAVAQYGLPQAVARLRDPALSGQMAPQQIAAQIADPLPVRSRDEFGQVTEAFNAVHLEAVRTAAEQAALRASVATMFVNLARRSQILVDRLIGHLDRLERGEQDPDRLSELFQLDHLATRMRRNDENLLVLAGADSTRIQREPAALVDVLRAAQSEVEHYTRIEFGVVDQDVEIAAHSVNDLVHLVAELFDNATAYSPPDTAVIVEARRMGERAVLTVEDRGIGMSSEQYSELNERLASPPTVDVTVSRMMGLVVVARLANRHGVRVELRRAPERGTIAEVQLPPAVLVPRALAGRTATPAGFPASRPAPAEVPARPVFPAPLALESGPAGVGAPVGAGWPGLDAGHGGPPDLFGPPNEPYPPTNFPMGQPGYPGADPRYPAPASEAPPAPATPFALSPDTLMPPMNLPPLGAPPVDGPGFGGNGFGSSNGYGAEPPVPGNGRTTGGRPPAWHDLTGATGGPAAPPAAAPPPPPPAEPGRWGAEPLPQRRPGAEGEDTPLIPRQTPASPEAFAGPGNPPYGSPEGSVPATPYGLQAPPLGRPAEADHAAVPRPAAPPAWPPASAPPAPPVERETASDYTTELPQVARVDAPPPSGHADYSQLLDAAPTPPSRYADDLTMELPIFRELESAWFRVTSTAPDDLDLADVASATPAPASVSPPAAPPPAGPDAPSNIDVGGAERYVIAGGLPGSSATAAGRPTGPGGTGGANGPVGEVSWRTIADDGWAAAAEASKPKDGGTTDMGLPKRVPMAQLVPGGVDTASAGAQRRTPESVRGLLSAYHRGVQRGRSAQGNGDAGAPGAGASTAPHRGKEQEA
ncbi:sensor histidine kinase [Luedemannella helvata]|uniref:histidine kinase n=1 Tax=Luedemannella helvata TaxID=349315 RepID=A0ABP4VW12_9ACTN